MGIAQQLEPYIKSITGMMEQIQPEVGRSTATSAASVGSTTAPNNQQTAEQSLQQVYKSNLVLICCKIVNLLSNWATGEVKCHKSPADSKSKSP